MTPSIVNPFFPELVAGVHPELRRRGYSLMLIDTEEPEADAARVAESRLVDGVLLVGSVRPTRTGSSPLTAGVPVVAFDRAPAGGGTTVVQCDNVAGATAVVEHLVAGGHTRIAHIGGPAALDVAQQRATGYRTTLAAHGLGSDDALVAAGDFSEDSGYAAALELLARGEPPTAVFAANDMMAIGAIAAFQLSGMVVPTDVAVAGFDGIHLGRYVQPTLTTYAQPIAAIAAAGRAAPARRGRRRRPGYPPRAPRPCQDLPPRRRPRGPRVDRTETTVNETPAARQVLVQTVLGPVPASELGTTLPHEHLFSELTEAVHPGVRSFSRPLASARVSAGRRLAAAGGPVQLHRQRPHRRGRPRHRRRRGLALPDPAAERS